jgi:hypothetical protein
VGGQDQVVRTVQVRHLLFRSTGTTTGRVQHRWPVPGEALLRGKERTYDVTRGIAHDRAECSTVATEVARSILEILRDRGGTGEVNGGWGYRFAPSETAWDEVSFTFHPLLPQGTWVE